MVQLNAFKVETNAGQFLEKFKAKGYPVLLDHEAGDRWYKIKIGPFSNWESAEAYALKLRATENLKPLVLVAFSVNPAVSGNGKPDTPNPSFPDKTESQSKLPVPDRMESAPSQTDGVDADSVDRVIARFLAWKQSWQTKDLESYLEFYSDQYDAAPRSRPAWERSRKRVFSRKGEIQINIGEMEIVPDGNRIEMRFIQEYKSSGFQDTGYKTLVWCFENGRWKILSERWLPI